MSTKHKLQHWLRNPLVLIPPIILVLALGWRQYSYAGRNYSLPASSNIFPTTNFANFVNNGLSADWHIHTDGTLTYHTAADKGYTRGHSLLLSVGNYHVGSISLISPKLSVRANTTYLFKGYYTTDTPLALLTRYFYTDGTNSLIFNTSYPAASGSWSTASTAFKTDKTIAAVQFIYRLHGNGTLKLNSPYLQPAQDVYIASADTGQNTIPNANLDAGDYNVPTAWSTYHRGASTASFTYDQGTSEPYLQVSMSSYKDGEAKWQYAPQPTHPHQYYALTLDYKSDTAVPLVAEYTTANGRHYTTIGQLQPADEWTRITYHFETPPDADTLFVSAALQHNGTIATRHYQLVSAQRPGPQRWPQPVVSLAFDDGWQSAYDNALPVLKAYGYTATFYINPAAIETPGFMNADELFALKNGGNEIASQGYSYTDLTAVNNTTIDYQLREGRNYLQRAGYTVSDTASPYGRSDAEVAWYARKYFTTLRSMEAGINTRQSIDPYNLKVLYITDKTSLAALAENLKQIKAYDGWLILVYHRIGGTHTNTSVPAESSTTSVATFQQQLKLLHASGIRILPVATAYTQLEQQ